MSNTLYTNHKGDKTNRERHKVFVFDQILRVEPITLRNII